jgi:methionyl aminopeptidase
LVSIDIGAYLNGYHGDAARSFFVGEPNETESKLLAVTRQALERGIAQARDGNFLGDISFAIQSCAEENGFSVVRDLVGHGIGRKMHEEPQIPNYGKPKTGIQLKEGMTMAIEPMVNLGTWMIEFLDDNWTVVTKDRKLSAHFENTIAITKDKAEVLTIS